MSETKQKRVTVACSFCLKSSTDVTTIVAGPGVYICDECVSLCDVVIKNRPTSVQQLTTWDQITDLDAVLWNLPRIASITAQVEHNLRALVRRARTLGATWAQIGTALSMTRQAAWERFSGEE